MPSNEPTPPIENGHRSSIWFRLLFIPFFLAGSAFFVFVTVLPLLHMFAAREWKETPCVIESSRVVVHEGEDSASFSVEVAYRYQWEERHFISLRYSFVNGSWIGYRSKQAIVAKNPPGRETVCFVNAKSPGEAVLNRGWQPEMGMGVFGLLVACAGALRLAVPRRITQARSTDTAAPRTIIHGSKREPVTTPFGTLIVALFWNGFIGAIAYFLFFVEDRENVATAPKVIIGLFVLAGLALLWNAFVRLRAGSNRETRRK